MDPDGQYHPSGQTVAFAGLVQKNPGGHKLEIADPDGELVLGGQNSPTRQTRQLAVLPVPTHENPAVQGALELHCPAEVHASKARTTTLICIIFVPSVCHCLRIGPQLEQLLVCERVCV